jgi:uncharacterized protein
MATGKPGHGLVFVLLLAGFLLGPGLVEARSVDGLGGDEIGEPVSFAHGSTTLSGHLVSPPGPGPHPAFVAIEGSGDASYRLGWTEGYFPFWSDITGFLVDRGYAVLLFEKPGVGASTGDWRRQSFGDRADEVLSAVRHLADREDIDGTRIGLIGHSQGGWIAQIAGARDPDRVGFLILLAGPSISVKEQIRDDVENGWICRGITGPGLVLRRGALRLALGLLDLVAHVARPLYLARIIHFDPIHVLPEIGQPTLALFAGNDPLVMPEENRARLVARFGTAMGNPRVEAVTVDGADHFFRQAPWCPGEQRAGGWAPGFFDGLAAPGFWGWVEGGGTPATELAVDPLVPDGAA